MLNIIANICMMLLENLYFYIPICEIKNLTNLKNKIILFVGIFIINIISNILFGGSIFMYFLNIFLIYCIFKVISKDTTNFDFFIIPLLMLVKFVVEYVCVINLIDILNFDYIVVIFETINIIFAILITFIIKKIYNEFYKLWNGSNTFIIRYIFLLTFNSIIVFIVYNLNKLKEVI